MTLVLIFSIIISLAGIGVKIWASARTREKLKQAEALNDQNDELLDFIRKEKVFASRLRNNPDFADRVRQDLDADKE